MGEMLSYNINTIQTVMKDNIKSLLNSSWEAILILFVLMLLRWYVSIM